MNFLLLFSLHANELHKSEALSYEATDSLLKSIQNDAIIYGTGDKSVYVFIDPLCKFSRKFISTIAHNEKMLLEYRYYIYLYAIPRLKSHNTISAIYTSKNQIKTLLDIMIEEETQNSQEDNFVKNRVERIASIAQTIGVNKRPYLFIEK